MVLEAPGGGLDGSGSVAKYLGDPQAPLVVGRLRRLDEELNFSFPILQGFNVEMLLAVHLFLFISEYFNMVWFFGNVASNLTAMMMILIMIIAS